MSHSYQTEWLCFLDQREKKFPKSSHILLLFNFIYLSDSREDFVEGFVWFRIYRERFTLALSNPAFLLDENGDNWKGGGTLLEDYTVANLPGFSNLLTAKWANLFSIFWISLSILRNNAKESRLINSDCKNSMKTKRSNDVKYSFLDQVCILEIFVKYIYIKIL